MSTIPIIMEWLNAGATVLLAAVTIWVVIKVVNVTPKFVLSIKETIQEITTALTISSAAVREAVELIDKYDTRESQVISKLDLTRLEICNKIDSLALQYEKHSVGSNENYHEMCELANKILDNLAEYNYISTSDINELRRILTELNTVINMNR